MTTKNYSQLILEGELRRENGDFQSAIALFEEALSLAKSASDKFNALRHLGLCFEHMRKFVNAEQRYQEALDTALAIDDIATCKRHLSSVALKTGDYQKALNLALEARNLLFVCQEMPSHLVWITHAIVSALHELRRPKKVQRYWLRIEYKDLRYAISVEQNKLRKDVWMTGFIMNAISVDPFIYWPLAPIAIFIALKNGNLGLRLKQMLSRKR